MYVHRYAVMIQLLWSKSLRSLVIDTRAVLTIVISRVIKKRPMLSLIFC